MPQIRINRTGTLLTPDSRRVLLRPHVPRNEERIRRIVSRVMALPAEEAREVLKSTLDDFSGRHRDIRRAFEEQYLNVRPYLAGDIEPGPERRLLLGAYFTQEYAFESAALFNPSIVPHPDQSGLPSPRSLRVVLSLRATGEGHISSLTFRSGVIDAQGRITLEPPSRFAGMARQKGDALYDKACFEQKLLEMGLANDTSRAVMNDMEATFTLPRLEESIRNSYRDHRVKSETDRLVFDKMLWLARCNYELSFDPQTSLSERIIFPSSPSEQNGIEDARFVRFRGEEGRSVYYATYTAYDGRVILPQLLETEDFLNFKMITLNGPAVENKGMALFPRKIRGKYAMISRQDNENLYLMFSDNLHFWHDKSLLMRPAFPWEFVQTGNCGSPIETKEGWLVITHGVGPVRKYCIGAILLDLEDPGRIIGRLKEPLISPNEDERSGYVPNVVYTCGAILHQGNLIIPYAISDRATTFAKVAAEELLSCLKS